jgi:rubredoxin
MNEQHICVICGHIHDEELEGEWDKLPEDFVCPECGCNKEDYVVI